MIYYNIYNILLKIPTTSFSICLCCLQHSLYIYVWLFLSVLYIVFYLGMLMFWGKTCLHLIVIRRAMTTNKKKWISTALPLTFNTVTCRAEKLDLFFFEFIFFFFKTNVIIRGKKTLYVTTEARKTCIKVPTADHHWWRCQCLFLFVKGYWKFKKRYQLGSIHILVLYLPLLSSTQKMHCKDKLPCTQHSLPPYKMSTLQNEGDPYCKLQMNDL